MLVVLVVSTVDDLVETALEEGSTEVDCVGDSVSEEVGFGGGNGVGEELIVTIIWLVVVTVGVIVMVVASPAFELLGVVVAGGS